MSLFTPLTGMVSSEPHAAGLSGSTLAAAQARGISRTLAPFLKIGTPAFLLVAPALVALLWADPAAMAQQPAPSTLPVVGVLTVERRPITESYEFNGRIQPIHTVNVSARVTAWLDKQHFVEGVEVKKGDLLYTLEKPPFLAAVEVQKAAVAQAEAQLENATIDLHRAQQLVQTSAGTQKRVDDAQAAQRVAAAQLKAAQAQLQTAQINLAYTDIFSPVPGRIGRTSVTVGNLVSPSSGTLTTVVSQDPIYAVFTVPTRRAIEFRERYADNGGFDAVKIRVRLPDGRMYDHTGKLDFINNSISENTDTLLLRAVIPNPTLDSATAGGVRLRELIADEFVTVLVESLEPRDVIAVPRAAILADQQGPYLYVVDADNVARQRRVQIGQSTPEVASIVEGLKERERVIVEGVLRARPNALVSPAPASLAMRSAHK